MCGIFAYLNHSAPKSRQYILETLVNGLKRLEYRGYDSAGVAVDGGVNAIDIYKSKGKVDSLKGGYTFLHIRGIHKGRLCSIIFTNWRYEVRIEIADEQKFINIRCHESIICRHLQ